MRRLVRLCSGPSLLYDHHEITPGAVSLYRVWKLNCCEMCSAACIMECRSVECIFDRCGWLETISIDGNDPFYRVVCLCDQCDYIINSHTLISDNEVVGDHGTRVMRQPGTCITSALL